MSSSEASHRGKHTLPPISAQRSPIFFDPWVLTFHAQLNAKGTVQKFGVCERNCPHLPWSDEREDTREQPQAGLRDGRGGGRSCGWTSRCRRGLPQHVMERTVLVWRGRRRRLAGRLLLMDPQGLSPGPLSPSPLRGSPEDGAVTIPCLVRFRVCLTHDRELPCRLGLHLHVASPPCLSLPFCPLYGPVTAFGATCSRRTHPRLFT